MTTSRWFARLFLLALITVATGCQTGPSRDHREARMRPTRHRPPATPSYVSRVDRSRLFPTRWVPPLPRVHRRPAPTSHAEWAPPRLSGRWNTIVIHHSAGRSGDAETFDKSHRQRGWDELGYHFVIGNGSKTPDGFVEVGPRWTKQKHGAHCKTPDNFYNDHGIGICLVGDFTRDRPTWKQMESLKQLTSYLARTCGIPASQITTHKRVTGKTACPGNLPLETVRQAVASTNDSRGGARALATAAGAPN